MVSISDYLNDAGDIYAPVFSKSRLQRIDNYQIYSVLRVDYPYTKVSRDGNNYTPFIPQPFNSIGNGYRGSEKHLAIQTYGVNPPDTRYIQKISELLRDLRPRNHSVYKTQVLSVSGSHTWQFYYWFGFIRPSVREVLESSEYSQLEVIAGDLNAVNLGTQYSAIFPPKSTVIELNRDLTWTAIVQTATYTIHGGSPSIPDHSSFIAGYSSDPRILPQSNPQIVPTVTEDFTIRYYRQNKLESHPDVNSLDWRFYQLSAIKGQPLFLPLIDVAFGSLSISSESIKQQLSSIGLGYKWSDFYFENIDLTWNSWVNFYNSYDLVTEDKVSIGKAEADFISGFYEAYQLPIVRILAANNNCWLNDFNVYTDLNADTFRSESRSDYLLHIKPQFDNGLPKGVGTLKMDSPRIIEIHKALNADKYAFNDLDNTKDRVSTLGYYIDKISSLLGHRVDANGEVDLKKEAEIVPQILNKPKWKQGDTSYSQYCFGKKGIVIPSLPTSYDKSGKLLEQYHICQYSGQF
jgi:hypothetical protein